MALVGVGAALVLALTGCGGPHKGTVHDKAHEPGHYTTESYCATYNKDHVCTYHAQRQRWVSPDWELDIYNGDDHGWVDVSEGVYKSVKIGDHVDLDK